MALAGFEYSSNPLYKDKLVLKISPAKETHYTVVQLRLLAFHMVNCNKFDKP